MSDALTYNRSRLNSSARTNLDSLCFEGAVLTDADLRLVEQLRNGGCPATRVWISCISGALLLLLTAPVLIVTYCLVRLTSRGPGFYSQTRVGLNGEPFSLIKFRTMVVDAEKNTGPVWSQEGDSRVTWVGRILRISHLDELPQLVNVLKGEMALVGPRPERPEISLELMRDIIGYNKRLSVRPGITGLAQINLPADSGMDSVRRKLLLEFEYVATASLRLDLQILLATVPVLLGIRSKLLNRLFGVYRRIPASLEEKFRNDSGQPTGNDSREASHVDQLVSGLVIAVSNSAQEDAFVDSAPPENGNGNGTGNGHSTSSRRDSAKPTDDMPLVRSGGSIDDWLLELRSKPPETQLAVASAILEVGTKLLRDRSVGFGAVAERPDGASQQRQVLHVG